jgi:hypothetical protein
MTYYSNASHLSWIGPGDLPGSIPIIAGPDKPGEVIDIALGAGFFSEPWTYDAPVELEAASRLVIGDVTVAGRFVLRHGAFIEVGEGAA